VAMLSPPPFFTNSLRIEQVTSMLQDSPTLAEHPRTCQRPGSVACKQGSGPRARHPTTQARR